MNRFLFFLFNDCKVNQLENVRLKNNGDEENLIKINNHYILSRKREQFQCIIITKRSTAWQKRTIATKKIELEYHMNALA